MQQNQPTPISPEMICQQAIQAKLNLYQAKENSDAFLKGYNDQVDNLINLINLMKKRIVELEGELAKNKTTKKELVNA